MLCINHKNYTIKQKKHWKIMKLQVKILYPGHALGISTKLWLCDLSNAKK